MTKKPKSQAETYSDLLTMRLDLQRSLATAPAALQATLETALVQISAELAARESWHQQQTAKTWHMVTAEDQRRIACGHCAKPAIACFHAYPGFFYYCQEHADIDPLDRVWQRLSNADVEQILCSTPACDEHATHGEWVPTEANKGVTHHFCNLHAFYR
jgi:hypothetical protein